MEKIKGLSIDLDLDSISVDRGLKGLKDSIRSVNSEMRRNMSAFDRSERSVLKYETRLSGLNKKLEVQKRVVSEAQKNYEEMVKEHGKGSKEAEKAAREYNNQAASLNNLERYIERTKNELIEFQKEQRIANSSWTQLGNKLESYGGKLQGIGSKMNDVGSQMTKKVTMPVLGVTTAVGGMVSAFGWKRLTSLDTAQAQLKGLGFNMKEVEVISGDVNNAVQGTTMTMAEGTSVAAGAIAAGVKQGKELERYIKRVGNAAIGANRPVEEMAMIFNRVEGAGKLMTQELNSIEAGMPGFSKAMSDHLGVAPEEMRKMVTAGEVTSKDFAKVMDNFAGDMAKEYANTWDGMVSNTKANIGIIGETFLRGVFQDSKKSLADFIDMLKSPEIKRRAEEMGVVVQRNFRKARETIMGVVEWYNNLDDSQKTLIKRLGLVAVAGGPVLQLTGKLTSGFGSVLGVVGNLSKAIGVARGAGLVAGLTALGPAAAGGIAIAGLVGIGYAVYETRKAMREGEEGTVEYAKAQLELTKTRGKELDAVNEQIEQTEDLIESYVDEEAHINKLVDSYDSLMNKSKLTAHEFGEFIELQEELSYTKSPERVNEINERLEELRTKSGLSKDELNKLLETNKSIEDLLPGTTTKIDEYGHSYANAAGDVRELINAELELKRQQIYESLVEDSQTLNRESASYKDTVKELLQAEQDVLDKKSEIAKIEEEHVVNTQQLTELEKNRSDMAEIMKRYKEGDLSISEEQYDLASENMVLLNEEILERESKHKTAQSELDTLTESLKVDQERLDEARQNKDLVDSAYESHLNNYNLLKNQLEEETGIVLELGKENDLIDEQISKNEKSIQKLEEKRKKHGDNDGELQKQIDKLLKENDLLDENKDILSRIGDDLSSSGSKLDEINGALSNSNTEYLKLNDEQRASNSKLDLFNAKLRDSNRAVDDGTRKQKSQGSQIDSNNKKTDLGIKKEKERTTEAGKKATKNINVTDNGTINSLNERASSPVSKYVNLVGKGLDKLKFWEDGTPPTGHPGGMAMIGEAGRELVQLPNGQAFVSPNSHTLLNLPKGSHVIPNHKTERLLKNIPGYANGTKDWDKLFGNSDFSRLIVANESSSMSSPSLHTNQTRSDDTNLLSAILEQNKILAALLNKDTTISIDGRAVARQIASPIENELGKNRYSQYKSRRR